MAFTELFIKRPVLSIV
ncbi:hypothetical protein, partial [Bradyrhizobium guangdongense]